MFCLLLINFCNPTTEDGWSKTTFYYCSVNHQSGLQSNPFSKLSYIFWYIKMCHKLCHFIWDIWCFHWSKDFEAMKAGKSAIWPWLCCPYNQHTLMDLPSSVHLTMFLNFQVSVDYMYNHKRISTPFKSQTVNQWALSRHGQAARVEVMNSFWMSVLSESKSELPPMKCFW